MSSPVRFYPASARPYQHKPHTPRKANIEAKRQRRATYRAVTLRQLRTLKIQANW